MPTCLDCSTTLTETNWSESYQRERIKVCRPCAVERTKRYEAEHRDRRRRYNQRYYAANKAKFKKAAKVYYSANREKALASSKRSTKKRRDTDPSFRQANIARAGVWQRAHRLLLAERAKQRRDALRKETLDAYGHTCACPGCSEMRAEFLAIDHTNSDGAAHRRELGDKTFGGAKIYLWLKKRGFPTDRFRLLCHNCNLARGCYGYCPHERENATA